MSKHITLICEVTDDQAFDKGGNQFKYQLLGLKVVGASIGDLMTQKNDLFEALKAARDSLADGVETVGDLEHPGSIADRALLVKIEAALSGVKASGA